MSFLRILFSFKGRITRGQFWLGSLVPGFIIGFLLYLCFASMVEVIQGPKEDGMSALLGLGRLILPVILGVLTCVWIAAALYTKRLHDRGKGAIWLLAIYVPSALPLLSLIYFPEAILPCSLVAWASNMWVLIELGGMAGTPGPNRFDEGQTSAFLDDTFGEMPKKGFDWSVAEGNGPRSLGGMEAAMAAVTAAARANPAPLAQMRSATSAPAPQFGQRAPAQFGRLNAAPSSGGFGRKV
jgi:uncharacterized membrane protein YhaH (DUF805 family)